MNALFFRQYDVIFWVLYHSVRLHFQHRFWIKKSPSLFFFFYECMWAFYSHSYFLWIILKSTYKLKFSNNNFTLSTSFKFFDYSQCQLLVHVQDLIFIISSVNFTPIQFQGFFLWIMIWFKSLCLIGVY